MRPAMRFPAGVLAAVVVALGLFWLMHWLIAPPEGRPEPVPEKAMVTIVGMPRTPDQQQSQSDSGGGRPAAPKPPPIPGLARPTGMEVPIPEANANVVMPELDIEPKLTDFGGMGDAFAGFAGGGAGGGMGGGFGTGFGSGSGPGQGGGPDLVPLSTSRPQIPRRACALGIEGWAAVTFTVTPSGDVTNIEIIGAEPRGVFEQAMVESVQDWLYKANDEGRAYRVSWKFKFRLEQCDLNWRVGS